MDAFENKIENKLETFENNIQDIKRDINNLRNDIDQKFLPLLIQLSFNKKKYNIKKYKTSDNNLQQKKLYNNIENSNISKPSKWKWFICY